MELRPPNTINDLSGTEMRELIQVIEEKRSERFNPKVDGLIESISKNINELRSVKKNYERGEGGSNGMKGNVELGEEELQEVANMMLDVVLRGVR